MRFHPIALLPLLLLSACGGDDSVTPPPSPARYQATPPTLLSQASPTKDEDPSVMLAKDGSIVVAWFSDRGGNSDPLAWDPGNEKQVLRGLTPA